MGVSIFNDLPCIYYNNVQIIMIILDILDEIYDRRFGSHKSFYKTKGLLT